MPVNIGAVMSNDGLWLAFLTDQRNTRWTRTRITSAFFVYWNSEWGVFNLWLLINLNLQPFLRPGVN